MNLLFVYFALFLFSFNRFPVLMRFVLTKKSVSTKTELFKCYF